MPQQKQNLGDAQPIADAGNSLVRGVKRFFGADDDDEDDKKKQPPQPQGGGADPKAVQAANQSFMARKMKEKADAEKAKSQPAPQSNVSAARNRYGSTKKKPQPPAAGGGY
jgi:hypothetical protein